MQTKFKLCNPDALQASITITATVKEWKELRAQLSGSWPSWDLSRQIGDVIREAEKTFYASEKTK